MTGGSKCSKIIALTETGLKSSKQADTEVTQHFPNSHIIRQDRKEKLEKEEEDDPNHLSKSGGCMIISSNDIPLEKIEKFSNGNVEHIIAKAPTLKTAIICVYNPPSTNFSLAKFKESLGKINKFLDDNSKEREPLEVILTGDFNFPSQITTWENTDGGTISHPKQGDTDQKKGFHYLSELVDLHNLVQIVNKPTHNKEILDLLYTSKPDVFSNCETSIIQPESDHNLISFTIPHTTSLSRETTKQKGRSKTPEICTFDFESANKEKLLLQLNNIHWKDRFTKSPNVSEYNNILVTGIVEAAKKAKVPRYPQYPNSWKLEEDDPTLQLLVQARDTLNQALQDPLLLQTHRETKVDKLQETNRQIQERIDTLREEEELKVIEKMKKSTKAFFEFANKNRRVKSAVGPLKKGKHYYDGPEAMAEILSAQYEGAFSTPLQDYSQINFQKITCPELNDLIFTEEDIIEVVKDINFDSAPGPDGITAFLIKTYISALASPLHFMWRASLDTGLMPEGRSKSIITPIFKGGNKSEAKDYRPVSLTNHTTKIFERVLRKALIKHMESNNVLNNTQHGFRSGRSCISQLLSYYDSVLSLLDQGHAVDAIYLDFAKAFDKVDHTILLKKLSSVNVGGKIWSWIKEFLTNREQRVKVEGFTSAPRRVISGVPQGSVLGPLLFLVMIMDIDKETLEAMVGIFADDTRMWRVITGKEDSELLQGELKKAYNWADTNNATYNSDKFEAIRFQKKANKEIQEPIYQGYDGSPILFKNHIKDLGVWMSANLSFQGHIIIITNRAKQISGMTLRTFKSRKTSVMLPLLKNLIRNLVEYACPIWSPKDSASINRLEDIQRKFTSKMSRFREFDDDLGFTVCTTPYSERLHTLKLLSLQRRRERYTIIYMFKIKCGLTPNPGFTADYQIRAKAFAWKPRYDRKTGQNSFFCTGPLLYNSIPARIRSLDNMTTPGKTALETFKSQLDKYLTTLPDNPGTQYNSLLNLKDIKQSCI